MRILLIGKTGQLGGDILDLNHKHEIFAPARDLLDVTSKPSVDKAIKDFRPDVVINTSAFHNVPLCETDYDKAFLVNCIAVRDLAASCRNSGVILVTFSSDYVFGGEKRSPYREDDKPAPLQIYGITRAAGEYAAMSVAPEHSIVIRTCGLYGKSGARSKGGNFVDKRLLDAKNKTVLEMSCEQIISPTYTEDLSLAIFELIDHPDRKPGIYHLVNEGECSWYEFTKAIYEIIGLNMDLRPVDRGGKSGDMRRPLYSVLANTKAKALGIELPHWRNGLERYLKVKKDHDRVHYQ